MSVKVEEVANRALAAIDSSANLTLAGQWVGERYRIICQKVRMRHLRKVGHLIIPALLETGTCTITLDSNEVVGDADATAAWVAAEADLIGRFFRLATGKNWYQIRALTEGKIELAANFVDPTAFGNAGFVDPPATITNNQIIGATYTIAKRYFRLEKDVRWIGTFVFPRFRMPLKRCSQTELDVVAPDRFRQLGGPLLVADAGSDDEDQQKIVEMYPYSMFEEEVLYLYWQEPPMLAIDDKIPNTIDVEVLKEGALIDAMRYEAAKAIRAGQLDAGAYWRNEYRQQETSWEKYVARAIRADRGEDDLTFVLRERGWVLQDSDITTAREQIMATRTWPV